MNWKNNIPIIILGTVDFIVGVGLALLALKNPTVWISVLGLAIMFTLATRYRPAMYLNIAALVVIAFAFFFALRALNNF